MTWVIVLCVGLTIWAGIVLISVVTQQKKELLKKRAMAELTRLGGSARGNSLRKNLEQGSRVSVGWFYVVMRELEKDGLVEAEIVPGGPERNFLPDSLFKVRK